MKRQPYYLLGRLALVVLLAVFGVGSGTGWAQAPGTFIPTGKMITVRAEHTATLLLNGKVLITGGVQQVAFTVLVLASAELYDPSTGTFTATGNMTTARAGHTATLLPDGRVLIAGGSTTASAELYDPSTGTFTATGNMTSARVGHTATLLPDGRVLIAGGYGTNGLLAGAELYDPTTGTFAPTGNMTVFGYTATLLADGTVLIADAVYDPRTGIFSPIGPMSTGGDVNTATLLMNGKVLIAGNYENDGSPADAEVYDPSTGKFTGIGNTIYPHEFSTATLLPDGTVLIAGGQMPGGWGSGGADLYAPATGTFYAAGVMTTGRHEHTATLLSDGTVLMAGGFSDWPAPTSSAELYHPPSLVPAPALFSLSGDGQGQGAILHAGTTELASASNPATAGEALETYCTGLMDGSVIPPEVSIGGRLAEVLFFGKAPGWPGLNQVNIRLPSGVAPGPAVPVRLTYLGRTSNEVTIAVR